MFRLNMSAVFYRVMERFARKIPQTANHALFLAVAGRTDYGALKYFTEFWPSDNTDGYERGIHSVGIFVLFSRALPRATTLPPWANNRSNTALTWAMMGKMGLRHPSERNDRRRT